MRFKIKRIMQFSMQENSQKPCNHLKRPPPTALARLAARLQARFFRNLACFLNIEVRVEAIGYCVSSSLFLLPFLQATTKGTHLPGGLDEMRSARCCEPDAQPVSLLIARMCCGCFPHSLPLEAGGRARLHRKTKTGRTGKPGCRRSKNRNKNGQSNGQGKEHPCTAPMPTPPSIRTPVCSAASRAGMAGADLASAGSMRPPPSPARHVSTARLATTKAVQETAGRDKSQPGSRNAYPQTRHATTTAGERTANTSPTAEADAPTQPQEARTAAPIAPSQHAQQLLQRA